MDEQNFGEHFSSSGILDGTGPAANNPVGLLSHFPENNPVQASRPPQASVDSAMMPVYEPLEDPKLDLTPVCAKITVFPAPLLDPAESEVLRTRWNEVQAKFVDEPGFSVKKADALVSEVIARITSILVEEYNSLQGQWHQSNDVSTEELRTVLQHYRSFFNRMVD